MFIPLYFLVVVVYFLGNFPHWFSINLTWLQYLHKNPSMKFVVFFDLPNCNPYCTSETHIPNQTLHFYIIWNYLTSEIPNTVKSISENNLLHSLLFAFNISTSSNSFIEVLLSQLMENSESKQYLTTQHELTWKGSSLIYLRYHVN